MFLSGSKASSLSAIAIPVCQVGTTKDQCALLALLISKFPHKTFSFLVQLKKLLQCKFKIPLFATIHFSFYLHLQYVKIHFQCKIDTSSK